MLLASARPELWRGRGYVRAATEDTQCAAHLDVGRAQDLLICQLPGRTGSQRAYSRRQRQLYIRYDTLMAQVATFRRLELRRAQVEQRAIVERVGIEHRSGSRRRHADDRR